MDYKKAFDRVYHEKLIEALKHLEVKGKDPMIKNLYWKQTASIQTEAGYSKNFLIKHGGKRAVTQYIQCLYLEDI